MGKDEPKELALQKFKLKDISPTSTILLVGCRGSGKSFLIRDILYEHRQIPMGLIFSATEEANHFFGDFFPDSFIYSEYDADLVDATFTQQMLKVSKCKKAGIGDKGKTPQNRFLMVLDDMMALSKNWKRDETISKMFYNGRHYNFFFIVTMQDPMGLLPAQRGNLDYIFMFNDPSLKNRKKLYEDFAGQIASFEQFNNILDACTNDYGALVVNRTSKSNKLTDQIFWYKANDHPSFRVLSPSVWKFHEQKYNEQYKEQDLLKQTFINKTKLKYDKTKKLKVFVNKKNNSIIQAQEESDSN
jgi:hypothetical protein